MITHYVHLACFSSLHLHKLLNRFQTERGKSLKDNETPTSAPAVERTDPSSCLWEGRYNSVITLSLGSSHSTCAADQAQHTRLSLGRRADSYGYGSTQDLCDRATERDTASLQSVRFCSFCCSHNSPVNISIAWTESSTAPPIPAAGPVASHDFQV